MFTRNWDMTSAYMKTGDTERITVFAINGQSKITGAAYTLKICRLDNGQYWNGTAFQAGVITVNMTEVDSVNRPGEYVYAFTPPGNGYICSVLAETSNANVAQKIHTGTLHVGYGFVRDTEIAKKYIRNKTVLSGASSGTYTVYEDDEATVFESGTFNSTTRDPS